MKKRGCDADVITFTSVCACILGISSHFGGMAYCALIAQNLQLKVPFSSFKLNLWGLLLRWKKMDSKTAVKSVHA